MAVRYQFNGLNYNRLGFDPRLGLSLLTFAQKSVHNICLFLPVWLLYDQSVFCFGAASFCAEIRYGHVCGRSLRFKNKSKINTMLKILVLGISLLMFNSCDKDYLISGDEPEDTNSAGQMVTITRNVEFGSNTTQGGSEKELFLDVYQPAEGQDQDRRLVLFVHGGGFNSGDRDELERLALAFAQEDFVSATVDYRLADVELDAATTSRAVMDGVADVKAALRYFYKDAVTDQQYGIRTDNIFVVGYSAGAGIALHLAYLNDMEDVGDLGGDALRSYVTERGGLEGNSGNPGFPSAVSGIASMSGALGTNTVIDAGEPVLFSVHGPEDPLVPYTMGVDDLGITLFGPAATHPLCEEVGIENLLVTVEGAGHGTLDFADDWLPTLIEFVREN
jgi:acetyl esterase/lipase